MFRGGFFGVAFGSHGRRLSRCNADKTEGLEKRQFGYQAPAVPPKTN